MANEPTLKGTLVQIGFPAGVTITGTIRDGVDHEATGDIETVRDENNNEVTFITSNLGDRYTIEFTCAASIPALKKGDTVEISSAQYIVESANIRSTRTTMRGTATLYKPVAATLTTPGG